MATSFQVTYACPDCGAHIDRTVESNRARESFDCIAPCTHRFAEPPDLWSVAVAMLTHPRSDAA